MNMKVFACFTEIVVLHPLLKLPASESLAVKDNFHSTFNRTGLDLSHNSL